MSIGLLALLDDVVGLAKVAVASLDDVSLQAARAGTRALGLVIDDAAVTPRYVVGFAVSRELPIVWKIAVGSAKNKYQATSGTQPLATLRTQPPLSR